MEFKMKTTADLVKWLEERGYNEKIRQTFEENEVDGHSFLLLTKKEIEEMVKPIGPRMKLLEEQTSLLRPSQDESMPCSSNISEASGHDPEIKETLLTSPMQAVHGSSSSSWADSDTQLSITDTADQSTADLDNCDHETSVLIEDQTSSTLLQNKSAVDVKDDTEMPRKRLKVKREKKEEPPLEQPFILPENYPKIVEDGISAGSLIGHSRTKFVSTVAASVYHKKAYPTSMEYDHVARQIVRKYNFMSDDKGSHEYLIKQLDDKVKYFRTYKGKSTTKGLEAQSKPECKVKLECLSKPRPPLLPNNDDDIPAYERHIKFIQREYRKLHPDKMVVTQLMKKTFTIRRKKICEEPMKIVSLLGLYPSLRSYSEIINEFLRVVGKENESIQEFWEPWKTLKQKILSIATKEDNAGVIKTLALAGELEDMSDDSKSVTALCCLCFMIPDTRVKPDYKSIITFIPENDNVNMAAQQHITPTVMIRGSLSNPKDAFLAVEKEVLCKLPNVSEVALTLLSTFYVFNMQYTHGTSNVFVLLEYYFMGIKAPKEKTKVGHLISELAHVM